LPSGRGLRVIHTTDIYANLYSASRFAGAET
jgi:hypothetical protein